jgi:hypothetical protein
VWRIMGAWGDEEGELMFCEVVVEGGGYGLGELGSGVIV